MSHFDAVIFDWMLTLAHYPSQHEHVETAARHLGRSMTGDQVASVVSALEIAGQMPEVEEAALTADTSLVAHHHYEHLHYRLSGIDQELADQMYGLLGTPGFHQPYPDVLPVLEQLQSAGLKIGVASDIHVDIRVHADQFGIGRLIDVWALSFEVGAQKPDPRIFQLALDQLGTDASRTLMVGDSPSKDGAAAKLGMPCLILPAPDEVTNRGLDRVLDRVGLGR